MASASIQTDISIADLLAEADLEEFAEICMNKGLKKARHLQNVSSSQLQEGE